MSNVGKKVKFSTQFPPFEVVSGTIVSEKLDIDVIYKKMKYEIQPDKPIDGYTGRVHRYYPLSVEDVWEFEKGISNNR